ncbi:PD-(D/E)XK motif protein [Bifidobacterium avesanii]|nr:PD-(D/E)XK motif protein [Bifidobacterium avesanii]
MTMSLRTTELDPWRGIKGISSASYYPSRRVSADLNPKGRRIDWSISESGNRALIVEYQGAVDSSPVPRFKGMRIREDKPGHLLMLELTEPSMRDVFLKVCLDIIAVLQSIPEDIQRQACLHRLERWSVFFRTERIGLGAKEQKGLIAELVCLENLLTSFDSHTVIASWVGPDRAVHDFIFGQDAIEVKSNRGSGTPNITISSVDQLTVNEKERLFLFVVELNQSAAGSGLTMTQYVERVRNRIASPLAESAFEEKLATAGYFDVDDYSGMTWSQGMTRVFSVTDDFPHIDGSLLDPAISNATYRVNLDACGKFETTKNELLTTLRGV